MFTLRQLGTATEAPSFEPAQRAGVEGLSEASPKLEVISKLPSAPRAAPPLLFVHGAWHGAWCWDEYFLDYFAAHGYAAHALSLRGHGASEGRDGLRFFRMRDYVADVEKVAASLPTAPVLIGHSTGGFVVQKYLQTRQAPAAILLASIPPTGSWRTLARTARMVPMGALKTNLTLSLWPVVSDAQRARRLLFSPSLPEDQVLRHHDRLQDESFLSTLDALALDLVDPLPTGTPTIVMGASNDVLVHPRDVRATAQAYGVAPTIFEGMAHDMMLEAGWRKVADEMIVQLDAQFRQPRQKRRPSKPSIQRAA